MDGILFVIGQVIGAIAIISMLIVGVVSIIIMPIAVFVIIIILTIQDYKEGRQEKN